MKTLIIILLTMLSCSSCTREDKSYNGFVYAVKKDKVEPMQEWILQAIKNANNHADEEMEDVIVELRKTALQLFGKAVKANINLRGNFINYTEDFPNKSEYEFYFSRY